MKQLIQNVRGTRDVYGLEAEKYNYLVNISKKISQIYNFTELNTPILEFSEVFERNLGEGSDIILKEVYKFEDRGGNMLTLRPEFTAGIVRSFVGNGELNQNLPQKFFSAGPIFRYERPQKGRYRQFNQINFEYFGSKEYIADVEIMLIANSILKEAGLKNIAVEINSLGSADCKKKYEKALVDYFISIKNKLSEDSKIRLEKNPLRILDSKDENDRKLLESVPRIADFYTQEEKEFFENILKKLDEFDIKYVVNPMLVRGLDYYTSTVFEFTTTDLGAQSSVLGGGRYDDMVGQMGTISVPAVGFAIGADRMMLLLDDDKVKNYELIAVIPTSDAEVDYCLNLSTKLRNLGKKVEFCYSGKLKKKMERADKIGAKYAIIVGENEIESGMLLIKDLENGEEKKVKENNLFIID